MKLIIAFLIIGSFAILETAAVPLCVCPRIPRQYVRQQYSLPQNYRFGQKAISESDNEEPSFLAIVSGDKEKEKREEAGDDVRIRPRPGKSLSHPISESDDKEHSFLAIVSGDKEKKGEEAGADSRAGPRPWKSLSQLMSESDDEEPSLLAIVSGDKEQEKRGEAGTGSRTGPRRGKSLSQPSRVFSGADSSQPEYEDDMRFLYGN